MNFSSGFGQLLESKQTLQPQTLKHATPYMVRFHRRWRRVFCQTEGVYYVMDRPPYASKAGPFYIVAIK